jgi:hypothetical protein
MTVDGVGLTGAVLPGSGVLTVGEVVVNGSGLVAGFLIDGDAAKNIGAYGSVTLYSTGTGRYYSI